MTPTAQQSTGVPYGFSLRTSGAKIKCPIYCFTVSDKGNSEMF